MADPTRPERPVVSLALADRQLARAAVGVFLLAGSVALLGPYLSYRSDQAQLHQLFEARVARDAAVFGDSLGRHLLLLQTSLEKLASRTAFEPDGRLRTTQEGLALAYQDSALFGSGIALVDAAGATTWAVPDSVARLTLGRRPWMRRLVAMQLPTIEVLPEGGQTFLLAVPLLREGRLAGALLGLFQVSRASPLPLPTPVPPFERVIFDERGEVLLPASPPAWALTPGLVPQLDNLIGQVRPFPLAGPHAYVAEVDVGASGLHLALVGHEDLVNGPGQNRFLLQMLLLMSLQVGAVLVLSVVVRRFYRRFLATERWAVEQERLLSLGGAASLIAHEVKNSLNGLKAAASLLSSGEDPALPIRSIRGEVDRLQHLAQSLLMFGKPAGVQLREVSLPELVGEVVEGLKVLPEADEVVVRTELGPPQLLSCDPLLLATAVHNLVRNAIEASVAAKDLGKVREPRVEVRVGSDGGMAVVAVSDNAGGPSPEVVGRLFEPFVTGKPKGIGLGLSMTRRAVEDQGGTVTFAPTREGSCFTIRMPTGPGHAEEERP